MCITKTQTQKICLQTNDNESVTHKIERKQKTDSIFTIIGNKIGNIELNIARLDAQMSNTKVLLLPIGVYQYMRCFLQDCIFALDHVIGLI